MRASRGGAGGRRGGRGGSRAPEPAGRPAPSRASRYDLFEAEDARDPRRNTAMEEAEPSDGSGGELPEDFDDEEIPSSDEHDVSLESGGGDGEAEEGSEVDMDNGDEDPWEQIERVQQALRPAADPSRRAVRPSRAAPASRTPLSRAEIRSQKATAEEVDAFLEGAEEEEDDGWDADEEDEEDGLDPDSRARMLHAAGVGVLSRKRKLEKVRGSALERHWAAGLVAAGAHADSPRRWC
jgi:hypothetical protein